MVRGRVAGRGPRVAAARRRTCARTVVDRAGGALRRAVFLAVLAERFFGFHLGRWQLVRRHHHGRRAARHRTHRRRRDSTAALLTGGADRRRGARSSRSAPRCWRSQPTAASCTVPKDCCSACPPVRCSASPMSPSSTSPTPNPPPHGLVSPWAVTALVAAAISFYASARSLQLGPAVEVIALTSVAANLSAII